MIRRNFMFALCATVLSLISIPALAQQAAPPLWQPLRANTAGNVVQTQALVAVPPAFTNPPVIVAQQIQPGPIIQGQPQIVTQPPVVTAPPVAPPPSASYDMYNQPGPLAQPGYAAPAFGSEFGAFAPGAPCGDAACGMPGFIGFIEVFQWDAFTNLSPFGVRTNAAGTVFTAQRTNPGDDTGYRIGLGFRVAEGWDGVFAFTDFDTAGRRTVGTILPTAEVIGLPVGFSQIVQANGAFDEDAFRETVALNYEVYDFEFGRKFCICRTLILRPYFGIRISDVDLTRTNIWYDFINAGALAADPSDDVVNVQTLRTRTSTSGVGPRLGSLVSWNIAGSGFQVFSRGGLSLLWTDIRVTQVRTQDNDIRNNPGVDTTLTFRDSYETMLPVAEIAVGLKFERNGFFVSGGYEAQNWFDILGDQTYPLGPTLNGAPQFNDSNDIGLGGWFLRGGYNY